MHNWNDHQYFLAVARLGSLNAAAKYLGVTHSTVLRRINALEDTMKVRLFERFHSGYVLTPAGEGILQHVETLEESTLAIERTLLGQDVNLSGTLKISTSDTIGYYWLPSRIKAFAEKYPDIMLDIDVTTRQRDLTKREADIVLSAAMKQPEHMVGKVLQPIHFALYAHQDYIATHGILDQDIDLNAHNILSLNDTLAHIPIIKWLENQCKNNPPILRSDKFSALYQLCQQGIGIAPLPSYVGDQDDALVAVMDTPQSCDNQMWLLTHPDIRHTARIQAFMEFF